MGRGDFSPGGGRRRLSEGARRSLELARRAAELAREAAEVSAEIAARQERLALWCTPESQARLRVSAAHRRSEACQRTAARLHENYVRQLETWLGGQDPRGELRPVFMSTVANVAGWDGALLTLLTQDGNEALVAASDPVVRSTHELEVSLGEGPSWEAMRDQSVTVARGLGLERRWPCFGPAVRELGVHSVAAAPMCLGPAGPAGSLTVIATGSSEIVPTGFHKLGEVADALATVLLTRDGSAVNDDGLLGLNLFEQHDFQPSLHVAAGVLHERWGYDVADAVALIRAHAFAESRPIAEVADEVIHEGLLT